MPSVAQKTLASLLLGMGFSVYIMAEVQRLRAGDFVHQTKEQLLRERAIEEAHGIPTPLLGELSDSALTSRRKRLAKDLDL